MHGRIFTVLNSDIIKIISQCLQGLNCLNILDSCSEREFGWNTGVEILQYKYSIDSKISVISVSRLYK